jgi:hypothetical protein
MIDKKYLLNIVQMFTNKDSANKDIVIPLLKELSLEQIDFIIIEAEKLRKKAEDIFLDCEQKCNELYKTTELKAREIRNEARRKLKESKKNLLFYADRCRELDDIFIKIICP